MLRVQFVFMSWLLYKVFARLNSTCLALTVVFYELFFKSCFFFSSFYLSTFFLSFFFLSFIPFFSLFANNLVTNLSLTDCSLIVPPGVETIHVSLLLQVLSAQVSLLLQVLSARIFVASGPFSTTCFFLCVLYILVVLVYRLKNGEKKLCTVWKQVNKI